MTFNLLTFHSDDGLRLAFKLGFGFQARLFFCITFDCNLVRGIFTQ